MQRTGTVVLEDSCSYDVLTEAGELRDPCGLQLGLAPAPAAGAGGEAESKKVL